MDELKPCWFCGMTDWVEMHHIFSGPYRRASTKYGLVVPLCHYCHNEPPNGVHHNHKNMLILKRWGQEQFEKNHTRLEFMEIFGRNYL